MFIADNTKQDKLRIEMMFSTNKQASTLKSMSQIMALINR